MAFLNTAIHTVLLLCTLKYLSATVSVQSEGPAPALVAGNCPDKCGKVAIPFPFGIGSAECFLHGWFEVVCNDKNGEVPVLKKTNLEVLQILSPGSYVNEGNGTSNGGRRNAGMIRVRYPITYSNCTGRGTGRGAVSLQGSPFYISQSENVFVAVGCNNLALLGDNSSQVVGCNSRCDGSTGTKRYSDCSGMNCCWTSIPSGLQAYDIEFRNIKDDENSDECKYALVVDSNSFSQNSTDLQAVQEMELVPVVLDWDIDESSMQKLGLSVGSSSQYMCRPNSILTEVHGYNCYCSQGFIGNVFLQNCHDVDECEDPRLNDCSGPCLNTQGSYECKNPENNFLSVAMGIRISLGATPLVLLILFSLWLCKIIRRRNKLKQKKKFFKRNGGLLLRQGIASGDGNYVEMTKIFTLKELAKATDNFSKSRVLGRGGQGTVYEGMLGDGRIVAVKKPVAMDIKNVEQFINEVVILSQINHRNVVKLLGCCLETKVPILVYEYIPNGTLCQYLHCPDDGFPMSWEMHLRVALEVAGALSYLHSAASIPVFHRDIKTTNIMLDERYAAKVADFGASKSVSIDKTHVTTLVRGTFGYLDPEYFQSSKFTDKSDVYSFGVVLAELLTREKAVSTVRAEEHRGLATYFILKMEQGQLLNIVDLQVLKQGRKEEITMVANLAQRCLNLQGRNRPTMREVVAELENVIRMSHIASYGQHDGYFHHEGTTTAAELEVQSWDYSSTPSWSSLDSSVTLSSHV